MPATEQGLWPNCCPSKLSEGQERMVTEGWQGPRKAVASRVSPQDRGLEPSPSSSPAEVTVAQKSVGEGPPWRSRR